MSFLTPLALLGALLAIPVILLYMLRLRRREVLVSSTFLWQQLLQDNEANTPWQRLRRNLLLLLQLIILALLVLALMRPFIIVPAVSTGQIQLLLDASASMNATDIDGDSRFEEAKRQALNIIDTLGADDTMTIIRVADVPQVIAPATNDPALLRQAINSAQPSLASANWTAALTLAAADAAHSSNVSIVIISDGGLGDASGLPGIPSEIQYIPVGTSGSNLAISALATRALPGQRPQLFAQVTNYGSQDAPVIFDLRVDGELFTAERYTVPAGGDLPLVSQALPENFTTLQAGITLAADSAFVDYLPQDNTAWTVSSGVMSRRAVVMTQGNLFLEQVFRSLPGVESFRGDITRGLPRQPFDLYVFDGWLPSGNLPSGDLLIINPPRSTPLFTVGAHSERTGGLIASRNDPRTAFVDVSDVNLLRFRQVSNTPWAQALIVAEGGPLLLAGEVDGRQVAVMTFDLRESDLPLHISWPVLVSNLLEWFTPSQAFSAPNGLRIGESLSIRPAPDATSVRVTLPDGSERTLPVDRETLVFGETQTPGLYRVDILRGEEVLQASPFAVNLFAPEESRIAPEESILLGGEQITESVREQVGQREFWPYAVLLALLVLLIEWVVYHRRVQARTVFGPALRRQRAS